MGHLIGPQHDSATLSLNEIWLSIIDSFVQFTLLTFRFSPKQLAFQIGMCTVQFHLLLVLLQVFIHTNSVSCNSCFIEESMECKFIPEAKNPVYFSLGHGMPTTVYQCDKPHFSGEFHGTFSKPFDLGPEGLGKDCDTFQYTFSRETLSLSLDQKPYFSQEITLAMDAMKGETWKVGITKVIIDYTTYELKELEFRIGTKTQLLAPEYIIRSTDKSIHKCQIQTPRGKEMTITVPKLATTRERHLVFVIGQDLPENVRISFSKANQKRQIHLGIEVTPEAPIRIEITRNKS